MKKKAHIFTFVLQKKKYFNWNREFSDIVKPTTTTKYILIPPSLFSFIIFYFFFAFYLFFFFFFHAIDCKSLKFYTNFITIFIFLTALSIFSLLPQKLLPPL